MGLGTLELFVEEGAKVLLADMQDQRGLDLETKYPGQVRFAHIDVTSTASFPTRRSPIADTDSSEPSMKRRTNDCNSL